MWTEFLTSDTFHCTYMSVLQALSTTLISVSVAIFTLSASFLVSKVDGIEKIVRAIESGGISLSIQKKRRDIYNFVSKMKSVTFNALISLPLAILGFIAYILFSLWRVSYWELLALLPLIGSIIFMSISLHKLIRWYIKFHKHH